MILIAINIVFCRNKNLCGKVYIIQDDSTEPLFFQGKIIENNIW